jgi:hypothetical protein
VEATISHDKLCFAVGVWAEDFMLLSFCDKSKICCINFARKLPTDFRKLEKLAALEPKVRLLAKVTSFLGACIHH